MVYVLNKDFKLHAGNHTVDVQTHAFKLGYNWVTVPYKVIEDAPFLFFYKKDKSITYVRSYSDFVDDSMLMMPEITLAEFFALKPLETVFKHFEEVIVRDYESCEWVTGVYSHCTNGVHIANGLRWSYCLPYTEETKKLVGTTDSPEVN